LKSRENEKEKFRVKGRSEKEDKVIIRERKTEKVSDRPGKEGGSVNKNPRPEKSTRRR
jgi:hypothetical protein